MSPTTDDTVLLQRIADGRDRSAFEELYGRYLPKAYALAAHLIGPGAQAEDAVQEAMIAVWQNAGRFDPDRGNAQSWILKVVANKSLALRRKSGQSKESPMPETVEHASAARAPEDAALKLEASAALQEVLQRLPASARRILALYYAADFSQEEIGKAMAMPQRTVSLKIKEALEELREHLTQAGMAASIPLLQGDALGDAIVKGVEVPADLGARIFSNLDSAVRITQRLSERVAPWAGKGTLFAAASLTVLAASAAGLWLLQPENGNTAAPEAPATQSVSNDGAPSASAPVPAAKLNKVWTFENGVPEDFELVQGEMEVLAAAGDRKAMLAAPAGRGLTAILPVELPARPFVVTVTAYSGLPRTATTTGILNTGYVSGHSIPAYDSWVLNTRPNYKVGRIQSISFFYFGNSCVITSLIDSKKALVTAVREYNTPYAGKHLALSVMNWGIERLEIQELGENEIPETLRDTEALKRQLRASPGQPDTEPLR